MQPRLTARRPSAREEPQPRLPSGLSEESLAGRENSEKQLRVASRESRRSPDLSRELGRERSRDLPREGTGTSHLPREGTGPRVPPLGDLAIRVPRSPDAGLRQPDRSPAESAGPQLPREITNTWSLTGEHHQQRNAVDAALSDHVAKMSTMLGTLEVRLLGKIEALEHKRWSRLGRTGEADRASGPLEEVADVTGRLWSIESALLDLRNDIKVLEAGVHGAQANLSVSIGDKPSGLKATHEVGLQATEGPIPDGDSVVAVAQVPNVGLPAKFHRMGEPSATGHELVLTNVGSIADRMVFAEDTAEHDKARRERVQELRTLQSQTSVDFMDWTSSQPPPKRQQEKSKTDPIKWLGNSYGFKVLSAVVVMANVMLVGWETNMSVDEAMSTVLCLEGNGPAHASSPGNGFMIAEWVMLAWMMFELMVNIYTAGSLCGGEDRGWNIFDGVLLVVSAIQLAITDLNVSFLRVIRLRRAMRLLRLMRLARVFKLLHIFKVLHAIRRMILCMSGSLPALFWACFLLCFLLFLQSLLFMTGIEMHYGNQVDSYDDTGNCTVGSNLALSTWDGRPPIGEKLPLLTVEPLNDSHAQQVRKLYGGILQTMLTLFGAISGGAEWPVVADPLDRISPVFTSMWVLFMCVTIFGVLNVFTSIFVEAAMQAASNDRISVMEQEQDQEAEAMKVLRSAFQTIDSDASGTISENELNQVLQNDEVHAMLTHFGLPVQQVNGLFLLLDSDSDGKLSMDEFIQGCLRLRGGAKRIDVISVMSQNKRQTRAMLSIMEILTDLCEEVEKLNSSTRSRRSSLADGVGARAVDCTVEI